MQAQADKGSGFISFKPDLDWYKKNKKKPKGAPSDWNNMSDEAKQNWISQNQPEERFDYQGGRFRPNQNNAQSNRVVNPYSIFDPSQDPLSDIPISQQFNVDSPIGGEQPLGDTQGKFMPSNPKFRGAGNNKELDKEETPKEEPENVEKSNVSDETTDEKPSDTGNEDEFIKANDKDEIVNPKDLRKSQLPLNDVQIAQSQEIISDVISKLRGTD